MGEGERLVLVETLREFRDMIIGFKLKIYCEHQDLIFNTSNYTLTLKQTIKGVLNADSETLFVT